MKKAQPNLLLSFRDLTGPARSPEPASARADAPRLKGTQTFKLFLILLVIAGVTLESLELLSTCQCAPASALALGKDLILAVAVFGLVAPGVLWLAERSGREAGRGDRLDAVLNNIEDGVLLLGRHDRFLGANPALLEMIPAAELSQMHFGLTQKSLRWGRKLFAVTSIPVAEGGRVIIFKDQTRCQETERARDALFGTVSHELRTPLAVVMNYLEMLLMMANTNRIDAPTFSQHLLRALESSRRLQSLVTNILDLAKIQAGILDLKKECINLPRLLDGASQAALIGIRQKKLDFEMTAAPDVPTQIMGDADRLQQVVMNLLDNAVKFTGQGSIRVNLSRSADHMLCIEVADTGSGIPAEQLPDIFEAFRRASNYAQREHPGAGLGLSIAREIVVRMGGDISVSSAPEVGSRFTVLVPLEPAEEQNQALLA